LISAGLAFFFRSFFAIIHFFATNTRIYTNKILALIRVFTAFFAKVGFCAQIPDMGCEMILRLDKALLTFDKTISQPVWSIFDLLLIFAPENYLHEQKT
jgi:hypothetical protein